MGKDVVGRGLRQYPGIKLQELRNTTKSLIRAVSAPGFEPWITGMRSSSADYWTAIYSSTKCWRWSSQGRRDMRDSCGRSKKYIPVSSGGNPRAPRVTPEWNNIIWTDHGDVHWGSAHWHRRTSC